MEILKKRGEQLIGILTCTTHLGMKSTIKVLKATTITDTTFLLLRLIWLNVCITILHNNLQRR
jgi:hypothetical protein